VFQIFCAYVAYFSSHLKTEFLYQDDITHQSIPALVRRVNAVCPLLETTQARHRGPT